MRHLSRLFTCLFVTILLPLAAHADEGPYPITADDGTFIANHRVPAEFEKLIEKLPGAVVVGNPNGKVTLNEFYDLNCPYCRKAAADIDKLLRTVKELRLVLVPFPVLGIPSIQAGKAELGVQQSTTPQQFYAFHRQVMGSRGVMDGNRAFAIAQAMGLDDKKIAKAANSERIVEIMIYHVRLGSELGIQATPGFIINGVGINGYPGPKALRRLIVSVERCGKVVCADKEKKKGDTAP